MKLQGQAFDTEQMYSSLGEKQLEEYAVKTGLQKDMAPLDASLFLNLISPSASILEIGCGHGRIGQHMLSKGIDYYGIELHKPYVDSFRKKVSDKNRIIHGNFLEHSFNRSFDNILFSWSVIGDFSLEGQLAALKKSKELLTRKGKIIIDIPTDIINHVEGYSPSPFNVHEVHDLGKIGLSQVTTHSYKTHTNRNREIIELN